MYMHCMYLYMYTVTYVESVVKRAHTNTLPIQ